MTAGVSALSVSADRLLQDVFVEREIRHDPLEPRILFLQRPKVPELPGLEVAVPLLPDLERGLVHSNLSTDVGDRRPTLDLPQA